MTVRLCAQCGERIPRTTRSGAPIKPSEYAKRMFCGPACYAADRAYRARHPEAPPPQVVEFAEPNPPTPTVADRFIAVLEDYSPLPLTAEDLAAETRAARDTIKATASRLVRQGRIRRWYYGREALYALAEERHA